MIKTLVSVIIPNYNGEIFVSKTLDSLLVQTHENWEAIIVDDGSTDSSIDIIKEYCKKDNRFKLLQRNTSYKGASVCRNIGIRESIGEFIIFLDSDDILMPWAIENRLLLMNKNPRLDFGIFNMGIFHETIGDDDNIVNKYSETNEYLNMFLSYDLPWAITCPIWRTSFIKNNKIKFDERFSRMQDPEFHTKILLNHNPNYKYFKNSKVDCYYRLPLNRKKTNSKQSIPNLVYSFELFLKNNLMHINDSLIKYSLKRELNIFKKKSYEILLMQNRLSEIKPLINYHKRTNNILDYKISIFHIYLFYLFNRTRLTFIKGIGIYRLWKLLC